MNKDLIEKTFSLSQENFPKCPNCTRKGIAFVGDTVLCGFCDWTESVSSGKTLEGPLAKWLKAKSVKVPFGDRRLQYLYMEDKDPDARNHFLMRAFERGSNLEESFRFRDLLSDLILRVLRLPDFQEEFRGKGFPNELFFGIHSKHFMPTADRVGAVVATPEGQTFRFGECLTFPTLSNLDIPKEVRIGEYLAQGGSWDFVSEKGGVFSSVIHLRPVGPQGLSKELTPVVDEAIGGTARLFFATYLCYNFYPRTFLIALDGLGNLDANEVTITGAKTCMEVSHKALFGSQKGLWEYYDTIMVQPLLWSSVMATKGPGLLDFCPKFFAALGSKELSISCCVSESLTTGEVVGRAAIRDNTKPFPSVTVKPIQGNSAEECIERTKQRMAEYGKQVAAPVFVEKSWDVLEMDPYVSLFELRNLWIWKDSRAIEGCLRRKPSMA